MFCWNRNFSADESLCIERDASLRKRNHLTSRRRLTTGSGSFRAEREFYFGNCATTARINGGFPAQPERYWISVDHTCVGAERLRGTVSVFDGKHRHLLECLQCFFYESFIVFFYFAFLCGRCCAYSSRPVR